MSSNLPAGLEGSDGTAIVRADPAAVPSGYNAPPPLPAEERGPDFGRYLAAVGRYKWLVAFLTVVGAAGGVTVARILDPVYQAQATIWVEPMAGTQGPIQQGQLLQNTNWLDLLRSFTVLDSVVKAQRLYLSIENPGLDAPLFSSFELMDRFRPGRYEFRASADGRSFVLLHNVAGEVQRGAAGDSVGVPAGFRWLPPATAFRPGRVVGFSVTVPRQAAVGLNARLGAVLPPRDGNFLKLTLDGRVPALTAATLNSIAEQFVSVARNLKREKLTELTRILDAQLQASYVELRRAENALETFKVNTITLPREEQAPPVVSGLQMTQTPALQSYFNMRSESDQLRRDREAIQRVLQQPPDSGISAVVLEAIPSIQSNSELRAALSDLTAKQAALRILRLRYTDDNPQVERQLSEIRGLQRQGIPAMMRSLLDDMRTRESFLNERINVASRDLREIPTRAIEEARLSRDVTIANQLYTNLQARYSEARLAEASSIPDVRILDPAVVPDRPTKNIKPLVALGSMAGSLALGIALALLLDRFDRRLRYPDQVTEELGLDILGAIPRLNAGSGRDEASAQVVEALRSVRLRIVTAHGSAGPLVVTITSPGSGDGKSFLASNLALSFADAGHRTLLIDGDIRRGTLHRVLKANRKPGLIDYLGGHAEREQVIQHTSLPSVDFIGCGTRRAGGPELLASPAMSQLLISLRSQYGVIIVDSAPLGAGVDPLVLGSLTGNLLLVLRTGVTNKELTGAKLGDLDRLPIRVLGAVLNDVKPEGIYKYYSYLPGYAADDEVQAAGTATGAGRLIAGSS